MIYIHEVYIILIDHNIITIVYRYLKFKNLKICKYIFNCNENYLVYNQKSVDYVEELFRNAEC